MSSIARARPRIPRDRNSPSSDEGQAPRLSPSGAGGGYSTVAEGRETARSSALISSAAGAVSAALAGSRTAPSWTRVGCVHHKPGRAAALPIAATLYGLTTGSCVSTSSRAGAASGTRAGLRTAPRLPPLSTSGRGHRRIGQVGQQPAAPPCSRSVPPTAVTLPPLGAEEGLWPMYFELQRQQLRDILLVARQQGSPRFEAASISGAWQSGSAFCDDMWQVAAFEESPALPQVDDDEPMRVAPVSLALASNLAAPTVVRTNQERASGVARAPRLSFAAQAYRVPPARPPRRLSSAARAYKGPRVTGAERLVGPSRIQDDRFSPFHGRANHRAPSLDGRGLTRIVPLAAEANFSGAGKPRAQFEPDCARWMVVGSSVSSRLWGRLLTQRASRDHGHGPGEGP
eukprot:CAMPEP_0170325192 /NCGR_PEP_ID=MMETSP0116_2-20130129/63456_1 /TAXON_ID=400756 /ORGANISM="Durinskia baltica, Strain CSIRO CS-38" /LENGTH=400 /DNA_ID=CAMNT_0010578215 /DNA_START=17 /DNA_END=1218 /DNA_ORIENTATION=+